MSAFTDNTEREKGNDFVTYFKAGTSIGVKKGNPKHIKSQDDLCGLRVGAEKGTIQATALTKTTADGAITLKGTVPQGRQEGADPGAAARPGRRELRGRRRPGRRVHR